MLLIKSDRSEVIFDIWAEVFFFYIRYRFSIFSLLRLNSTSSLETDEKWKLFQYRALFRTNYQIYRIFYALAEQRNSRPVFDNDNFRQYASIAIIKHNKAIYADMASRAFKQANKIPYVIIFESCTTVHNYILPIYLTSRSLNVMKLSASALTALVSRVTTQNTTTNQRVSREPSVKGGKN